MKNFLIGLLSLGLLMSLLGTENKTADGTVTVPTGCVYVVAVSVGTVNPPYLNGNLMQIKGSVPATGQVQAISIHVSTFPIQQTLPFVMNGANRVVWFFLDDAVCTRPVPVNGYSTSGQVTGTLDTSINDIVIGIVLGINGQVELKADTVALTPTYDSSTCRIGYVIPLDSSLICLGQDVTVASGYWYYPPAYYTDTSQTVLVTPGHYDTVTTTHYVTYSYDSSFFIDSVRYYRYNEYLDGSYIGQVVYLASSGGPSSYTYNTYYQTWVAPVYETQISGYWTYPDPVWTPTGVPGEVSSIFISVADTMIGSVYVTRPLCC